MKIKLRDRSVHIDFGIRFFNNGASSYFREDGPSVEYRSGSETWWSEGKIHRKYGPAHNWEGDNTWRLNGKEYTQEEFMEKFL